MTITDVELEKLLAICASATPGRWVEVFRRGSRIVTEREDDDESFHDLIARVSGIMTNAAHIVAFQPSSATALIQEIKRLREAVGIAREWLSLIAGPVETYDASGERNKEKAAQYALAKLDEVTK